MCLIFIDKCKHLFYNNIMERVILHSDLNSFYASVECCLNPMIKDLPVAVCGDVEKRHGIILASNQLAKKFGIRTGSVVWEAKKLCPNLHLVQADHGNYKYFSDRMKAIYMRYTDRIESFGIDECWLDVTESIRLFGSGKQIADEIRAAAKTELGITASVGVSYNKIFAKLGSDMRKPDYTTVIGKEDLEERVFPLPVRSLLMVGKKFEKKFNSVGIRTIGDLAKTDVKVLKSRYGKMGEYLWKYANGLDDSPVTVCGEEETVKSVSNGRTAFRDLCTLHDVEIAITVMAENVAKRLREQNLKGSTVGLFLRDNELKYWGMQIALEKPTFLESEIIEKSMQIFLAYDFKKPLRSVTVRVANLCPAENAVMFDLFGNEANRIKQEKLERTMDSIQEKYGQKAITKAVVLSDPELVEM